MRKRSEIIKHLAWLSQFCGGVSGWDAPRESFIKERARILASGQHIGAIVVPDSEAILEAARLRHRSERPPSHRKNGKNDCTIWEHCLRLLERYNVIFVSEDGDFCGRSGKTDLHPQLREEADAVRPGGTNLLFYRDMESLLSQIKHEVPTIPDEKMLAFVYSRIFDDRKRLEENSGARALKNGTVTQKLFTTDQVDIVEVRFTAEYKWIRPDGSKTYDFFFRGSCHYSLTDHSLDGLTIHHVRLACYDKEDSGLRAVEGSYVSLSATLHSGVRPIEPEPAMLGEHTEEHAVRKGELMDDRTSR